jgi:hypothetical protein
MDLRPIGGKRERESDMYEDNPIRRARVARGISLSEVTARTFLSPRVVQKIDEGMFEQLPGGLYARSYVRTFAALVGLDPDEVVETLIDRLPPAEDPIPVLRQNLDALSACQFEMWDNWLRAARACGQAVRRAADPLRRVPRRWLAGCVDGAVLSLFYLVLLVLTGLTLNLPPASAFGAAGIEVAGPWTVVAAVYYLWSLSGGRTAGRILCGLQPNAPIRIAIPRRLFH